MLLPNRGIVFAHVTMASAGPLTYITHQPSHSTQAVTCTLLFTVEYGEDIRRLCIEESSRKMVFDKYLGASEEAKKQNYYRTGSMAQGHHSLPPATVKCCGSVRRLWFLTAPCLSPGRPLPAAHWVGVSEAQLLCLLIGMMIPPSG